MSAEEAVNPAPRTAASLGRWLVVLLALLMVAGVVWSYASGGLVATLLYTGIEAQDKLAALKEFFHGFGWAAPAVYVLFVTVEVVVAPLPGAMLYAPGGIIFGGFWGGLLSTLGNTLGAGVACWVMRVFGQRWIHRLEQNERWQEVMAKVESRGLWIVALLRVNPLTSSDIVSYAAGLTSIPVWKVMAGTALGMAPLCFAQSYLADELLTAFPKLLYPLLAACAVYVLLVLWILRGLVKRKPATAAEAAAKRQADEAGSL